MSITHN